MKILAVNWADAFNVVTFSFVMVFVLLVLIVFVLNIFSRVVAPKVRVPKKMIESDSNSVQPTEKEYVEDTPSFKDFSLLRDKLAIAETIGLSEMIKPLQR